jgi:DNA-binding NarL/FixJ family response regulator
MLDVTASRRKEELLRRCAVAQSQTRARVLGALESLKRAGGREMSVSHVVELLEGVLSELDGAAKPDQSDQESLPAGGSHVALTPREVDVLKLVANGLTSKQIAAQLRVSVRTVETHRERITHKTGIDSVAGLTKYALWMGCTDPRWWQSV